ncbi:hypothetical protein H310_14192 [Aphanomyces invadans]|uniref:PH domain-containing protein n=1 Tax=Aphanomyces invadans TaxID=157072 RepID=A0A024TCV5_9STRA|nr:hypothetical protein H310_14192 [Aphanomyces invadans]ETV91192.1 hypothetical protein H310_14192 [Aphanomyces invadans]|eukprot:XP_008880223.1 hypothetical protein H310_14192 [Aphanomyces invadans]
MLPNHHQPDHIRGDDTVIRGGLMFSTGQMEARHFGHVPTTPSNQVHWSVRYVELSMDRMLRFYTAPNGALTSCLNVRHCNRVDASVAATVFTGRRVTSVWRVRLQFDNNCTIVLGALSKSSMHAWAAALQEYCDAPSATAPAFPLSKSKIPRTIAAIERIAEMWRHVFPVEPTTERRKRHPDHRTISASRLPPRSER